MFCPKCGEVHYKRITHNGKIAGYKCGDCGYAELDKVLFLQDFLQKIEAAKDYARKNKRTAAYIKGLNAAIKMAEMIAVDQEEKEKGKDVERV